MLVARAQKTTPMCCHCQDQETKWTLHDGIRQCTTQCTEYRDKFLFNQVKFSKKEKLLKTGLGR